LGHSAPRRIITCSRRGRSKQIYVLPRGVWATLDVALGTCAGPWATAATADIVSVVQRKTRVAAVRSSSCGCCGSTAAMDHFLHKLPKTPAFITLPQWVRRQSSVFTLSGHLRQKLLSEKSNITLPATPSKIKEMWTMYIQVFEGGLPFFRKRVGCKPDLDTFFWPVEI